MSNLTVLILAAGQGKRVKPIITSKPLLSFAGLTLLERLVDKLKFFNFKQLVIVVNPSDQFKIASLFPKAKIVVQPKATGMASAVMSAKKYLQGQTLILNGDDLPDQSIIDLLKTTITANSNKPILTGIKPAAYLHGAYFKLKGNQVAGLIEKPDPTNLPSPYFKLVLDYFPQVKEFVDVLAKTKSTKDDLYEVGLETFLKSNSVELVKAESKFTQFKYPWHILEITQTVLKSLSDKIDSSAKIHQSAVIDGPVVIESGVKIMANATIKGPVYLGKNTVVGNNALIRHSIIEQDSLVGYNTEIARSYIGHKSWFHCNYVGDSIIEGEVNLGSGARLANFRFDTKQINLKHSRANLPTGKDKFGAVLGKGVKLGINASIMPGVTIGAGSIVSSGVVLNQVVDSNVKVFVDQKIIIK